MNKSCIQCNCEFKTFKSRLLVSKGKFCSKKCFSDSRVGKSFSKSHLLKLSISKMNHIVSIETRNKMSSKKRGVSLSEEHRKALRVPHLKSKGEMNHAWKGGLTPVNKTIRNSMEYRDWRTSVFVRDNYTCQDCGSRGVTLNADHIKPFAYYPELRLVIENGRTLCVPCHKKTETYAGKSSKYRVLNTK